MHKPIRHESFGMYTGRYTCLHASHPPYTDVYTRYPHIWGGGHSPEHPLPACARGVQGASPDTLEKKTRVAETELLDLRNPTSLLLATHPHLATTRCTADIIFLHQKKTLALLLLLSVNFFVSLPVFSIPQSKPRCDQRVEELTKRPEESGSTSLGRHFRPSLPPPFRFFLALRVRTVHTPNITRPHEPHVHTLACREPDHSTEANRMSSLWERERPHEASDTRLLYALSCHLRVPGVKIHRGQQN